MREHDRLDLVRLASTHSSGSGSKLLDRGWTPQVKEFKFLRVWFMSEGMMGNKIDRRVRAAGAVLHALHRTVVTKRELSRKAKLSIYWSVFIPTLTYGHERWVMTKRMRSRVQTAEMGFLCMGGGGRDRVRSSAIQEGLEVEVLLLCVERSQLRWFGLLTRMPPGRLPKEVFLARPTGRRPRGGLRTRWRDYISLVRVSRCGLGKGSLRLATETAAPATRFWRSG